MINPNLAYPDILPVSDEISVGLGSTNEFF